jgi:hypothetical protein
MTVLNPDRGQCAHRSRRGKDEKDDRRRKISRAHTGHINQAGLGQAEGEKMSETPSLSIFTIEADRKPLLAFAVKKYQDAEAFRTDERVIAKLRSIRSNGVPLCDDSSVLRIRLATSAERAQYHDRMKQRSSTENLAAIFLVDVDKA